MSGTQVDVMGMTVEEYLAIWNGPWADRPEGYGDFQFTDQAIDATIAAGGYGIAGLLHPRQAEALRTLDTPARRKRAYWEASTLMNLQGGNLSGNIYRAVAELTGMIAQGREGDEMYAEGAARRHREAEAEMRRVTGQQVILYPPEMRRD